jgi:O-antigen ligase
MAYYPSVRDGSTAQVGDLFGLLVALGILGIFFITLDPLPNLADASTSLVETTGRLASTYIACFILTLASLVVIAQRGDVGYVLSGTAPVFILSGWLFVTVLYSSDPATSAQRLTLSLVTYALAAMLPWLTRGMHQFANLLLIAAGTVVALSYVGIALFPHLAVHQATDFVENAQAGDWRGIYQHKNEAAMMMVVCLYIGWLAARTGRPLVGSVLAVAALTFLPFSGGKSALGLVFITSGLAYLVARSSSFWWRAVVALGPLALIGLLTVGSVMSDTVMSILNLLPIDPTYTGRSGIWQFAINAAKENYLTGYGFEAFWHSTTIELGSEGAGWERFAHTSHNGYLDMALTSGLPGLILLVLAFVVTPLRDFQRTLQTPENETLAYFFLNVWLFMLYQNMFEAFFLSRADPMWFALALGMCGLRYTARYAVRA